MKPKQAIVLNYGMLCDELFQTMKEKTGFMSRFFYQEEGLQRDSDLMDIAQEFASLCMALKRFDGIVASKAYILKESE